MAKLVQEGPLTSLVQLDYAPRSKPYPDTPPGTLAVSADHQDIDKKLLDQGFARMVTWERPDRLDDEGASVNLTLWRKPGILMPKRGASRPPEWAECYNKSGNLYSGSELFSCCGVVCGDDSKRSFGSTVANVFLSLKKPKHDKNCPVIRIWEGKYRSVRPMSDIWSAQPIPPQLIFDRRVRVWLRLPYGCEYMLYDTRLI